MKTFVMSLVVIGLCAFVAFAQTSTYTGKAINIDTNDRGVTFTVVVTDENNKEVLRRDQWVSAGVMQALGIKDAIKNVVERMTQEIWAHTEGSKEFMKDHKVNVEEFRATCNQFVDPKDRPSPQDDRIK